MLPHLILYIEAAAGRQRQLEVGGEYRRHGDPSLSSVCLRPPGCWDARLLLIWVFFFVCFGSLFLGEMINFTISYWNIFFAILSWFFFKNITKVKKKKKRMSKYPIIGLLLKMCANVSVLLVLVAVMIAGIVVPVSAEIRCPSRCLCFRSTVRCMFLELDQVPSVPLNTTIL